MVIMICMARSAAEGGREAPPKASAKRPSEGRHEARREAPLYFFMLHPTVKQLRAPRERLVQACIQGTPGWVPELWVHRSCMHCARSVQKYMFFIIVGDMSMRESETAPFRQQLTLSTSTKDSTGDCARLRAMIPPMLPS